MSYKQGHGAHFADDGCFRCRHDGASGRPDELNQARMQDALDGDADHSYGIGSERYARLGERKTHCHEVVGSSAEAIVPGVDAWSAQVAGCARKRGRRCSCPKRI